MHWQKLDNKEQDAYLEVDSNLLNSEQGFLGEFTVWIEHYFSF
jgi:hypothetical protein